MTIRWLRKYKREYHSGLPSNICNTSILNSTFASTVNRRSINRQSEKMWPLGSITKQLIKIYQIYAYREYCRYYLRVQWLQFGNVQLSGKMPYSSTNEEAITHRESSYHNRYAKVVGGIASLKYQRGAKIRIIYVPSDKWPNGILRSK